MFRGFPSPWYRDSHGHRLTAWWKKGWNYQPTVDFASMVMPLRSLQWLLELCECFSSGSVHSSRARASLCQGSENCRVATNACVALKKIHMAISFWNLFDQNQLLNRPCQPCCLAVQQHAPMVPWCVSVGHGLRILSAPANLWLSFLPAGRRSACQRPRLAPATSSMLR